jgi:hypothetical protein
MRFMPSTRRVLAEKMNPWICSPSRNAEVLREIVRGALDPHKKALLWACLRFNLPKDDEGAPKEPRELWTEWHKLGTVLATFREPNPALSPLDWDAEPARENKENKQDKEEKKVRGEPLQRFWEGTFQLSEIAASEEIKYTDLATTEESIQKKDLLPTDFATGDTVFVEYPLLSGDFRIGLILKLCPDPPEAVPVTELLVLSQAALAAVVEFLVTSAYANSHSRLDLAARKVEAARDFIKGFREDAWRRVQNLDTSLRESNAVVAHRFRSVHEKELVPWRPAEYFQGGHLRNYGYFEHRWQREHIQGHGGHFVFQCVCILACFEDEALIPDLTIAWPRHRADLNSGVSRWDEWKKVHPAFEHLKRAWDGWDQLALNFRDDVDWVRLFEILRQTFHVPFKYQCVTEQLLAVWAVTSGIHTQVGQALERRLGKEPLTNLVRKPPADILEGLEGLRLEALHPEHGSRAISIDATYDGAHFVVSILGSTERFYSKANDLWQENDLVSLGSFPSTIRKLKDCGCQLTVNGNTLWVTV